MVSYFFDTYPLIEIVKNNPNFVRFIEENITTTKFNLVEMFFIMLEQLGEEKAKEAFERLKYAENDVPDKILFKAMKFRLQNRKKGFSYADCIGYIFAKENGMKFLTGDDAFKGMDNVEFVK